MTLKRTYNDQQTSSPEPVNQVITPAQSKIEPKRGC